ncbi:MAG: cytochrome c nitrite reductase small subunit [Phycisphaerae bacterium]|nr:cytochrome c nitrite reductase small subunit [Phycisphaerae bacterium]
MPRGTTHGTDDARLRPRRGRLWAIAALVAVGVAAGAAGFTFRYAEGLSYLSNDPKACVNCHVMREQYDGWQHASHHHVATCNDCHVPHAFVRKYLMKADAGWRHSKAFTLQNFDEPIRMIPRSRAVVLENCNRCHTALVDGMLGSAAHAGDSDCIRCHADVGHGPPR